MKVSELIKKLKDLPNDLEIRIFDDRKNLFTADEDGSSEGIETITGVGSISAISEKTNKKTKIAIISFDNSDYKDDGTPEWGSSLVVAIENEFR